jgi:ribosome-associated protein
MIVSDDFEIPEHELTYQTSRSSGPGGQNVNKLSTRVSLLFEVDSSAALTDEQRALLHERLGGRISKAGILRVASERHRTQLANRDAARERFAELLREALAGHAERRTGEAPRAAVERRLEEKRRRSRIKRERAFETDVDE